MISSPPCLKRYEKHFGHRGFLPWVRQESLDASFLETNRWWIRTLAGSPSGEPGFQDGPAALSRFNAPTGIAVAKKDAQKFLFIGDTGNRRIRLITF